MTDQRDEQAEQEVRPGGSYPSAHAREVIASARQATSTGDGEPAGVATADPLTDSGVHSLDLGPGIRIECADCGGKGYTMRTIADLLGDVVALIPPGGQEMVIKEFYTRLLGADVGKDEGDQLAPLFPPDLLLGDEEDHQRDRLWSAIALLMTSYRPGDRIAMEPLNTALDAAGRAHALFYRPDGTVRGATKAEYDAVGGLFIGVLVDLAGSAWRPEYTAVVVEAYGYAADQMFAAGQRAVAVGDVQHPRYPRRAKR